MKKKLANFEVSDLLPITFAIIVFVIAISYGMNIIGDQKESFCTDNYDDGQCRDCPAFTAVGNTTWLYNSSGNSCYNESSTSVTTPFLVSGSADYNSTVYGIEATAKLPQRLPLLATIVLAAVIISILLVYFGKGYK